MLSVKKYIAPFLAVIFALGFCSCTRLNEKKANEYGVFLGAPNTELEKYMDYELVVVDAAYFTKADIEKLKRNNSRVYSYLNIGSLEEFRPFYEELKDLTIGQYENWNGEYWVDVSDARWKENVQAQAMELAEKGVDGFFLDNADVYFFFPEGKNYDALVEMIQNLEELGLDIIINGADFFVERAAIRSDAIHITGVNQECVFSQIDFENNRFVERDTDSMEYYLSYLDRCRKKNLAVYLLEYVDSSNEQLKNKIRDFCEESGDRAYISTTLNLD